MPLGPNEMRDAQWELLQKYIAAQMQIVGKTEPEVAFQLMKLHWKVLDDVPKMQDVVDRFELSQLKVVRDNQDLNRTALDQRISDLEDATA